MFGSELSGIESQLKAMNYILQEVVRLLRNIEETMPRCSCIEEHAVGESWTCLFHGTVTKAQ